MFSELPGRMCSPQRAEGGGHGAKGWEQGAGRIGQRAESIEQRARGKGHGAEGKEQRARGEGQGAKGRERRAGGGGQGAESREHRAGRLKLKTALNLWGSTPFVILIRGLPLRGAERVTGGYSLLG